MSDFYHKPNPGYLLEEQRPAGPHWTTLARDLILSNLQVSPELSSSFQNRFQDIQNQGNDFHIWLAKGCLKAEQSKTIPEISRARNILLLDGLIALMQPGDTFEVNDNHPLYTRYEQNRFDLAISPDCLDTRKNYWEMLKKEAVRYQLIQDDAEDPKATDRNLAQLLVFGSDYEAPNRLGIFPTLSVALYALIKHELSEIPDSYTILEGYAKVNKNLSEYIRTIQEYLIEQGDLYDPKMQGWRQYVREKAQTAWGKTQNLRREGFIKTIRNWLAAQLKVDDGDYAKKVKRLQAEDHDSVSPEELLLEDPDYFADQDQS